MNTSRIFSSATRSLFATLLGLSTAACVAPVSATEGAPTETAKGVVSASSDVPARAETASAKVAPQRASTEQAIAVLSMASNANFGRVTDDERSLADRLQTIEPFLRSDGIADYLGEPWKMVWGPVAMSSAIAGKWRTDNAMFVAKGVDPETKRPLYVVSVSATNAVSPKGWLLEDFNVVTTRAWDAEGHGNISLGGKMGLDALLSMRDGRTGQGVLDLIDGLPADAEVAVAGHSLGGGLAPLLALRAEERRELRGGPSPEISAYPTAGVSPGDGDFARYAASKLGSRYHSLINTNDIVPMAWESESLRRIPSVYEQAAFNDGDGFSMPQPLRAAVVALSKATKPIGYERIAKDSERTFSGLPSGSSSATGGSYMREAAYQHTTVYLTEGEGVPTDVSAAIASFIAPPNA